MVFSGQYHYEGTIQYGVAYVGSAYKHSSANRVGMTANTSKLSQILCSEIYLLLAPWSCSRTMIEGFAHW